MMAKYHLSRSVVQWIDFSVFLGGKPWFSLPVQRFLLFSETNSGEEAWLLGFEPRCSGFRNKAQGSCEPVWNRLENTEKTHGPLGGPRFWRMPHRTGFLLAEFVAIVHPDALEAFRRLSTEPNRTTIFIMLFSSNLSLLSRSPTKTENGFHTYVYISNIRCKLYSMNMLLFENKVAIGNPKIPWDAPGLFLSELAILGKIVELVDVQSPMISP